jgi:drug/metabolite transporter (DMT)-like permease
MADKRELVQPPAVEINARRIVAIGTALFFLGFLVLLPFYGWLGRHDHRLWLWTCLAGALLGVLGYSIMRRHRGEGRTS